MTDTSTSPRVGPCAAWVTGSDALNSLPEQNDVDLSVITDAVAAQLAMAASEILYNLSGQQFTGPCGPVCVRPISRPVDADTRGIVGSVPGGYLAVYGWPSAFGAASGGAARHYGSSFPPEVELGAFPVIEVTLVKIDGTVIPPEEYYLQDHRTLVRRRPNASAVPTARYGWPTSQVISLPDSEPGTFSVTYTYGAMPPESGTWAATKLVQMLMLDAAGQEGVFPTRVTSVSRQGVTVAVVDVMDFFSKGLTGIYMLDLFARTFNPTGATRKPIAWSPDAGRPRRQPSGIT